MSSNHFFKNPSSTRSCALLSAATRRGRRGGGTRGRAGRWRRRGSPRGASLPGRGPSSAASLPSRRRCSAGRWRSRELLRRAGSFQPWRPDPALSGDEAPPGGGNGRWRWGEGRGLRAALPRRVTAHASWSENKAWAVLFLWQTAHLHQLACRNFIYILHGGIQSILAQMPMYKCVNPFECHMVSFPYVKDSIFLTGCLSQIARSVQVPQGPESISNGTKHLRLGSWFGLLVLATSFSCQLGEVWVPFVTWMNLQQID